MINLSISCDTTTKVTMNAGANSINRVAGSLQHASPGPSKYNTKIMW